MNKEKENQIIQALQKKVGAAKCPICNNIGMSIAPGYSVLSLQEEEEEITIGGPSAVTILTSCNNCGYVRQFIKNQLLK